MEEKIVSLLLLLLVSPFFLMVLLYCIYDFYWAFTSTKWPSVIGTITKAEVERKEEGAKSAIVKYTYIVDGVSYMSDRFAFLGLDVASPKNASKVVEGLAAGTEVAVFYCPSKPDKSSLRIGLQRKQVGTALFALISMFFLFEVLSQFTKNYSLSVLLVVLVLMVSLVTYVVRK